MVSLQVDSAALARVHASRFESIIGGLEEDKESVDEVKLRHLHLLSERLGCSSKVTLGISKLQKKNKSVERNDIRTEDIGTEVTAKKNSKSSAVDHHQGTAEDPSASGSTAQDMRVLLQDQKVPMWRCCCV